MAIPFNLPDDEETENNYRSMDDLLLQLYRVLRQILIRRHPGNDVLVDHARPVPHHHHHSRRGTVATAAPAVERTAEHQPSPAPDVVPRLPLPDLLSFAPAPARQETTTTSTPARSAAQSVQRRPRRRRQRPRDSSKKVEGNPREAMRGGVRDSWTQVGDDLRVIADDFRSRLQNLDGKPRAREEATNQKEASLLSLLVPARFRGSVWMAVVFLVGWGVLQRTR